MKTQIQYVAQNFVQSLRERLTTAEWNAMIAANAAETNPDICHSHDYVDANDYMQYAILTLPDYPDVGSDAHDELWNAAWARAKVLMQSTVVSATFEHPGYNEIRLDSCTVIHAGATGMDVFESADDIDAGLDPIESIDVAGGFEPGEVVEVEIMNLRAGDVTVLRLHNGCAISIGDDGVSLHRPGESINPDAGDVAEPVAHLSFL